MTAESPPKPRLFSPGTPGCFYRMAPSVYLAFVHALGQPRPTWEQLTEDERVAWACALQQAYVLSTLAEDARESDVRRVMWDFPTHYARSKPGD